MPENVVPRGLPYGEGQEAERQQRQAGLPTSREGLPSPGPAPVQTGGSPRPKASPVRPSAPQTDDPLMVLNPAVPIATQPTPQEQFQLIAERSNNPMMRLLALKLAGSDIR